MSCLPGLSLTVQFNTLASQIEKEPLPTDGSASGCYSRSGRCFKELVLDANWGSEQNRLFHLMAVLLLRKAWEMPPCLSTNILLFQYLFPERFHMSLSPLLDPPELLSRASVWSQVKDLRAWAPSSLGTNLWEEAAPWYFMCLDIGISDSKNKRNKRRERKIRGERRKG